jgi:hypothetical protein
MAPCTTIAGACVTNSIFCKAHLQHTASRWRSDTWYVSRQCLQKQANRARKINKQRWQRQAPSGNAHSIA